MNAEQAKKAIKTALGGIGFVDNPEELEEVIKFIDQQEKELNRAHRDAQDNEDRARCW
jgi:hypothetical protein